MNIEILHKEELENLNDKSMPELFGLLRELWGRECYFLDSKNPYKYLTVDYIIDEDQSVKWNREQVEINNKNWEEYQSNIRKERAHINDMIEDAIVHKLMDDYGFSHDVAYKVYSKAYDEWHDNLIDMECELEDLAEFVAEILKIATE